MSGTRAAERQDAGHRAASAALPGASAQAAPAFSAAPAAGRAPGRVYSRRALVMAFVAGLVVAGIAVALLAPGEKASPQKARWYYKQIQLGMTRTDVQRLMLPSYAMYSTIESSDIMIIDERFMIAVTFGPKPPDLAPAGTRVGQPPDDWVVKQKAYVDHKRAGWLEMVMTNMKLIPERLRSDRVRED